MLDLADSSFAGVETVRGEDGGGQGGSTEGQKARSQGLARSSVSFEHWLPFPRYRFT